jgi:hypothetical protein
MYHWARGARWSIPVRRSDSKGLRGLSDEIHIQVAQADSKDACIPLPILWFGRRVPPNSSASRPKTKLKYYKVNDTSTETKTEQTCRVSPYPFSAKNPTSLSLRPSRRTRGWGSTPFSRPALFLNCAQDGCQFVSVSEAK